MTLPMSMFAHTIFQRTYAATPSETWAECAERVASAVFEPGQDNEYTRRAINQREFIPGGRYLYCAGRPIQQFSNCFGFVAEDHREGWGNLLRDITLCLSMGGGLGVNYSDIRPQGSPIGRMGGTASGPLALMQMVNEVARHVMAGGKRRSALFGGLRWDHPDIQAFIDIKQWSDTYKQLKAENFEHPAPLDMTNVSVMVDRKYLTGLWNEDPSVWALHEQICARMCESGEPGFINMATRLQDDPDALTMNACCEATLHHNDVCNLGSVVLSRIRDLSHLEEVTRQAVRFLYAGSRVSVYPTPGTKEVAGRNRRIGLGLMGLHEWCLQRRKPYAWDEELDRWMQTWAQVADDESYKLGQAYGVEPVATRAIAPTGTISIIAETTGGIEPLFCTAYKRRYIDAGRHKFQYVVDPTARRLMDQGVPAKEIEDAYDLSYDLERRFDMQVNLQRYVDQAISNTINIPAGWDSSAFARLTAKYLPKIKGLTVYPDGARAGQPLSRVPVDEALEAEGVVFEEDAERCAQGVCGL